MMKMPAEKLGRRRGRRGTAETAEAEFEARQTEREKDLSEWIPRTALGKSVAAGKITSIEEIFEKNIPILEPEIVDTLLNLEEKVIDSQKTTRMTMARGKKGKKARKIKRCKNQPRMRKLGMHMRNTALCSL